MGKAVSATLHGDVLTVQPLHEDGEGRRGGSRAFVLKVATEAASNTLMALLPLLDRLLADKLSAASKQQMEEMIDFMAARMVAPSQAETEMAQRLAVRRARVLNEFGYFTAGQLAEMNKSQASNRSALADIIRLRLWANACHSRIARALCSGRALLVDQLGSIGARALTPPAQRLAVAGQRHVRACPEFCV